MPGRVQGSDVQSSLNLLDDEAAIISRPSASSLLVLARVGNQIPAHPRPALGIFGCGGKSVAVPLLGFPVATQLF